MTIVTDHQLVVVCKPGNNGPLTVMVDILQLPGFTREVRLQNANALGWYHLMGTDGASDFDRVVHFNCLETYVRI